MRLPGFQEFSWLTGMSVWLQQKEKGSRGKWCQKGRWSGSYSPVWILFFKFSRKHWVFLSRETIIFAFFTHSHGIYFITGSLHLLILPPFLLLKLHNSICAILSAYPLLCHFIPQSRKPELLIIPWLYQMEETYHVSLHWYAYPLLFSCSSFLPALVHLANDFQTIISFFCLSFLKFKVGIIIIPSSQDLY